MDRYLRKVEDGDIGTHWQCWNGVTWIKISDSEARVITLALEEAYEKCLEKLSLRSH